MQKFGRPGGIIGSNLINPPLAGHGLEHPSFSRLLSRDMGFKFTKMEVD
jgi:hypothetical protein